MGPTIVATIAAATSPTAAALGLAATTLVAAAVVRLLPYTSPAAEPRAVPRPMHTLLTIVANGALRRTLTLTVVVATAVDALPIVD